MQLTRKNLHIVFSAVLVTLLVVLLIQNSHSVTLNFIVARFQLPVFLVVLASALIGLSIGWMLKGRR